jgi:hypothetical protein
MKKAIDVVSQEGALEDYLYHKKCIDGRGSNSYIIKDMCVKRFSLDGVGECSQNDKEYGQSSATSFHSVL